MARTVSATAPVRVDFGGGTLDIFPLYIFYDGGMTINCGVNLDAKVWLSSRDDGRITIHSHDTGASLDWANGVETLPLDGKLSLITRLLRYYKPNGGLDVQTKMLTPHGSGLGASSALIITLTHALLAYMGKERDPHRIIRLSNGLEAQVIGMPAGTQDYYAPTFGGINAVHYDLEDIWVESLDPNGDFTAKLNEYMILSNTNLTHHSGMTNWQKIKNYFDGVQRTVDSIRKIKTTVLRFYDAFKAQDIQQISSLLNEEWENRKGLSDGMTTPEIDRMVEVSLAAGAWGTKLCGAGGGGCMLTLAPPEKREDVIAALAAAGATHMPDVRIVKEGVQVSIDEE
ncbi:MAG: GHMP family kinase ATP-binding protein [Armatimonadota bacterium]